MEYGSLFLAGHDLFCQQNKVFAQVHLALEGVKGTHSDMFVTFFMRDF